MVEKLSREVKRRLGGLNIYFNIDVESYSSM